MTTEHQYLSAVELYAGGRHRLGQVSTVDCERLPCFLADDGAVLLRVLVSGVLCPGASVQVPDRALAALQPSAQQLLALLGCGATPAWHQVDRPVVHHHSGRVDELLYWEISHREPVVQLRVVDFALQRRGRGSGVPAQGEDEAASDQAEWRAVPGGLHRLLR